MHLVLEFDGCCAKFEMGESASPVQGKLPVRLFSPAARKILNIMDRFLP